MGYNLGVTFTSAVQAQKIKMKLLTILVLALSLAYALGIECYSGSGDEVPTGPSSICNTEDSLMTNACYKSTTKDRPELTMRGCGLEEMEGNCGKATGVCTCTTDLCNGAKSFNPSTGVIFALIAGFFSRIL